MNNIDMLQYIEEIRFFARETFHNTKGLQQLSHDELEILSLLAFHQDPLSPLQISHKMNVSKPFISRLIEHLLKEDMIIKIKNESDKRSYFLTLTSRGHQELQKFYEDYLQPLSLLKKNMSEQDFHLLISLIEKANHIYGKE